MKFDFKSFTKQRVIEILAQGHIGKFKYVINFWEYRWMRWLHPW